MGLCTSKAESDDGHLDEVKMTDVKIKNFDDVFGSLAEAANKLVTGNNSILDAVENVKALLEEKPYPPFGDALKQIFESMKKAGPTCVKKFKFECDFAALAEGKLDVKLDIEIDDEVLPPKIQKAKAALFGDGKENSGLIAQIQDLVGAFAEVKGALDTALAAVKALPSSPTEIKSAAEAANIQGMELAKTPGRIGDNTKQTTRVPAITKQFLDTVKGTLEEIQNGSRALSKEGGGEAAATGAVEVVTSAAVEVVEHKEAASE